MIISTRVRAGAVAAAVAVVAGSLLGAVPANAATGSITLANTTYTAGSWGTGLDVTGAGFTASAVVTITVADSSPLTVDTHTVTADATGAFHEVYVPAAALASPTAGATLAVTATSDQGDTSNTVPLTVLAPKGIAASVSTITTADLADEKIGFDLLAAGYTPGETLTFTAALDGTEFDTFTNTAGADGSIDIHLWMAGLVKSGVLTITVTGGESGVRQSVDIRVTGKDVVTDDTKKSNVGTAAAAKTATPGKTPVVSG